MAEEKTRTIHQKILGVMEAVGSVAKTGHNDFQNYDYATEADILAAIRGELIKQQLVILSEVTSNQTSESGVTTLEMVFNIIDAETGQAIERRWIGTGHDKLDKGAYKALTGSMKYFLMKTFMIPTGDDPEREEKRPVGRPPRPVGRPPRPVGPSEPLPWDNDETTEETLERKTAPLTQTEREMAESVDAATEKKCWKCGEPAVFRKGVSKTGKPWRAYFCSTDDKSHVEWI